MEIWMQPEWLLKEFSVKFTMVCVIIQSFKKKISNITKCSEQLVLINFLVLESISLFVSSSNFSSFKTICNISSHLLSLPLSQQTVVSWCGLGL